MSAANATSSFLGIGRKLSKIIWNLVQMNVKIQFYWPIVMLKILYLPVGNWKQDSSTKRGNEYPNTQTGINLECDWLLVKTQVWPNCLLMWRPISTADTEGFITDYYTSVYVFYIKFCKDNFTIFVLSRIFQSIVSKTIDRSIVPMTIDRWRHQWRLFPLHCNERGQDYSKGKYPKMMWVMSVY